MNPAGPLIYFTRLAIGRALVWTGFVLDEIGTRIEPPEATANGAVTNRRLANSAVTSARLADGAVTVRRKRPRPPR